MFCMGSPACHMVRNAVNQVVTVDLQGPRGKEQVHNVDLHRRFASFTKAHQHHGLNREMRHPGTRWARTYKLLVQLYRFRQLSQA